MDRSHLFMEFHHSLISTTVATSIFFVIVIAILLQILNKSSRSGKLPPPRAAGAWPVIGHLHLLGGSQLAHKVLGDMSNKYGPIFTIKLGVHQALVVSNAKIAKECFTTNDSIFASRPKSKAAELMGYNYAMFGLAPYGDYWRQVLKIVKSEVLSPRKVEMLEPVRASELRASMKDLYLAWVINSKKNSSDMLEVEMKQWFGNLVLNVLVTIISGKKFSLNDEQAAGVRFQEAVRKFTELLGAFVASDFIPYLKHLDLGGYEKAMKVTAKEMDDIIGGWLKDHKESSADESGNQAAGFLDVLISVLEGASQEDFPGFDNDTIIKATCLTLLVAGLVRLDTTSVTLTWALSLLLNNPKALEIAQDEIDKHVGRDRLVQESDIKNLVYLNAIIKETLRLYPAGPLSVPHESMEDCIVGGYNIPKGTRLLVNLWKLHRDPSVWSDPNEFQPERFLTSQKDIDVKGSNFELLPFGSGRRMCPGVSFSLQTLRITLASLIQQFVLKRPSNEAVDMSESPGLTNSKATPLLVLLAPRLPLDMYHTTTA